MKHSFTTEWVLASDAIDYVEHVEQSTRVAACLSLREQLRYNRVRARGPIMTEDASPIYSDFWLFGVPVVDGTAFSLQGLILLSWFQVNVRDLVAVWPGADIAQLKVLTPKNRRGPRQSVAPRVQAEMERIERPILARMKEEEMVAKFNASRDTCRKVRAKLLAG